MLGKKPRPLTISSQDTIMLRQIARSRIRPAYQVQRARLLLSIANGDPVGLTGVRSQCDPATVWRICRRYEQHGISAVFRLSQPRLRCPGEVHSGKTPTLCTVA